jgi:hypothetical protein
MKQIKRGKYRVRCSKHHSNISVKECKSPCEYLRGITEDSVFCDFGKGRGIGNRGVLARRNTALRRNNKKKEED